MFSPRTFFLKIVENTTFLVIECLGNMGREMLLSSVIVVCCLWGVQPCRSCDRSDAPGADVFFSVDYGRVALIIPDDAGDADFAKNPRPQSKDGEYAQNLFAPSASEPEHAKGGWCARLFGGLKRWWQEASWTKRVVWVTVGTMAMSVGAVWLNGSYYLVFKNIKDYWMHYGVGHTSGALLSHGSGMVLAPTSSEMVSTVMASAAGATVSSVLQPTLSRGSSVVLSPTSPEVASTVMAPAAGATVSSVLKPTQTPAPTPTQRPPLSAGVCDLVESDPERYALQECRWLAQHNGSCLSLRGCAYNGDYLYTKWSGTDRRLVCRCKRVCSAPPKDLPCYGYNSTDGSLESCEQLPLCDKCTPHWCRVCNGWIPEATNISDIAPGDADFRAWLSYYGLSRSWRWDNGCLPGST